jgi:hypothetical protein
MQYPVKKRFKSLEGISYKIGGIFETEDATRVKKLQKRGLIGKAIGGKELEEKEEEKTEKLTIVAQKSGGWYELSDGRTVRKADLPEYLQ